MKILQLLTITKQKIQIITDEQPPFVLYKGEVARFGLEEGKELSDIVFEKIEKDVLLKRAKLRALHLLTSRDHTESELEKKLAKNGYTPWVIKTAMAYVKSFHYLDDERFAASYVSCYGGKKSKKQLEYELMKKGVSREVIEQCSELEEQDETSVILKILKKRCPCPTEDQQKQIRKQYAYLVGKGFSGNVVWSVLSEYFEHFS